jgi:hypothetical protein
VSPVIPWRKSPITESNNTWLVNYPIVHGYHCVSTSTTISETSGSGAAIVKVEPITKSCQEHRITPLRIFFPFRDSTGFYPLSHALRKWAKGARLCFRSNMQVMCGGKFTKRTIYTTKQCHFEWKGLKCKPPAPASPDYTLLTVHAQKATLIYGPGHAMQLRTT